MADLAAYRQASLTSAWLAGGRALDRLSMSLMLLALVAAFWGGREALASWALLVGVALGGAEKIYAFRVAFDQRVFALWAEHWAAAGDVDPECALAEFDQMLAGMDLRSARGATGRGLDERVTGACALLRKQAICLLLQFLAILIAAFLHLNSPGLLCNGY